MAHFISKTLQTLSAVGDSIAFYNTTTSCNCNIRHRDGSAIIRLKGGNCCNKAKYRITFNATITGLAAPEQLVVCADGEKLPDSLMSVVPAATTDIWSVNADTEVIVDCGCVVVSVCALTAGITINTASIIIDRIA